MRVTFVTHSLSRRAGGLFHSVRRLAQLLAQRPALEVSIVGLADADTASDLGAWRPLSPRALRVTGPAALGWAPDLPRTLSELAPDLTHAQGLWMYPSLACLRHRRRAKIPHLITPRGMLDPWALSNSRWKKRLAGSLYEWAHLREADCLHALALPEAAAFRQLGLRNPICVIPNGIDLPDGEPSLPPPPWADGRKTLLFLGRIHPKKGLPALLDAWRSFRHAEWKLVIAGWDQIGHEDELKKAVPTASVHFAGPLFGGEKASALAHADAFILPSLSEGLPMAILEAWSCSKPVLMTPACNLPEGFAAGAAIEIQSLPQALDQLAAMSAHDRALMGRRGRDLVESRFRWDQIAARMEAVYRWLLGGGSPPDDVHFD